MRISTIFLIILFVLAAGCMSTEGPQEPAPTITPPPTTGTPATAEDMVAFVMKAFEYAKLHGKEAAIAEFNNQTGRFVKGELYIFAYDLEGTTLALPFQPDLLGTSRWNDTDANGTAFIQEIIDTAQSGGGFFRYLYPDPAENFTVRPKISYAMMVDGDYVIGSGIYGADEDDPLIRVGGDPAVREEMKVFVEDAVAYAREHGRADALAEFNDPDGRFVSCERYIYAFDNQGTTLALPHQPQLIGTDLSGLQDPFGVNYTIVEIYLAEQGGGFLFYHYPNPAHNMALEPKMSYVAPVDETWWLGSGIYL
jgi:polar amino acid transport system substrate-binding protein